MKINPKARMADAKENRIPNAFGDSLDGWAYATVEVLSWKDVAPFCIYAAGRGYRLHTLRDGARGTGVDIGYRLVFEKVES